MSENTFPVNLDALTADMSTVEKEKIWSEIERQIDETPLTKGLAGSRINLSPKYKMFAGPLGAGLIAVVLVAVAVPVLLRQTGGVHPKSVTASIPASSVSVQQVAEEAVVLDQVTSFPWRVQEIHGAGELITQAATKLSQPMLSRSNLPSRFGLNSEVQYSSAEKKQWLDNGQNLVNDLFIKGTPTYTHEMKTLTGAVQNANGSDLFIDGGVSSLHWSSVNSNILNGMVTLNGTGDAWAIYAQWQPNQNKYVLASPRNKVNYTLQLKKINSKWMVQSFKWSFAKGNQP